MKKIKNTSYILEELIKAILAKLQPALTLERIELEPPKDFTYGDLTTNVALKVSSQIKQNPLKIADEIIGQLRQLLKERGLDHDIRDIKNQKGFINFFFSRDYYYEQLREILYLKAKFGKRNLGKNKKVLVEFVSANPTGPLSIAHARQAVIGDVLANVLTFLGYRVKREYYLNDEGNQIKILGESVRLRLKELGQEKVDFPPEYYQGEYIFNIAREIKNKGLRVKNFSDYAVGYILKIIRRELRDFRVKFDYWYSQKQLRRRGKIRATLDLLRTKGFLYEKEGALWFSSSRWGDEKDRVVLKQDGSYTYLAPDIAYHREKYRRGFEWLINFWGPDHHGYIKRLEAAVQALDKKPDSLSIIIVQLASIFKAGQPLQMSTRRGQYISLREIVDEVGVDTSRFFFLMRRTSSHLDFDLEIAKRHTPENPIFYIQYAHARICSILNKIPCPSKLKKADLSLLKEKEEMVLLRRLSEFPYYIYLVLKNLDPYLITVYMQNLANDFHKFYDAHRVIIEDRKLKDARIALITGAQIILASGLGLMGISRPKRM